MSRRDRNYAAVCILFFAEVLACISAIFAHQDGCTVMAIVLTIEGGLAAVMAINAIRRIEEDERKDREA